MIIAIIEIAFHPLPIASIQTYHVFYFCLLICELCLLHPE